MAVSSFQGRRERPGGVRRAHRGRARAFWLLLGCLVAAGVSCGRNGPERPQSLVLIVIDTLRGDRLGTMGYPSAVTPTLDSLAATGLLFRDAQTPAPLTLPATASLLTGRYPFHHGVRDNDRFVLGANEVTLAERFRRAGYRTEAVVASGVLASDRGLDQGFDRYDDAFRGPYPVYTPSLRPLADEFSRTRRRADVVTDHALAALHRLEGNRYFLLVHYFDVHMYYDPPPRFAAMHPGVPYDGEVSFVDHEIGRLLAEVRRSPRTLVVVVADHGESQNEHGEPQHGFLLYQATLHVPFLVSGPGVPVGIERRDPVSLIDVEPTLARAFHLPSSKLPRDGRALSWAQAGPDSVPLYAETFHPLFTQGWSALRALREGRWKLIDGPKPELYDLSADPEELSPRHDPAREEAMRRELSALTGGESTDAVVARARGGEDDERRELLQSLGYVSGTPDTSVGAGDRPNPRDELPRWNARQEAKEITRSAVVAEEARRWGEAKALADSALALDPDHVQALIVLAEVAGRNGEPDDAHHAWCRILKIEPDNRGALAFLAQWQIDHDRPDRGLSLLRRLVSQDPHNAAAQFNLGMTALKEHERAEAREHLQTFLELAPNDPQADRVEELLEDMKTEATSAIH
jgi:choline-sulfatase